MAGIVRQQMEALHSNGTHRSNINMHLSTIHRNTIDLVVNHTNLFTRNIICIHFYGIDVIYDEGYYGTITSIGGVEINSAVNQVGDGQGQDGSVGPVPFVRVVKRRTTANKKERRRTQSINSAFTFLRDCIPNVPSDTKLSKVRQVRKSLVKAFQNYNQIL